MTRPPMLAADHIRELTRTHITSTVIHRDNGDKEIHHVTEPALLTQLANATHGATNLSDSDSARGAFQSKPAAHLEAVDALARIDTQARDLAARNGLTSGGPLPAVLAAIAGKIGTEPDRAVRSWWATARMLSHHDTPPHRPYGVPCPQCWETDTLRIRIDDELATCTACSQVWDRTGEPDHGSLDVLGQHVAWCAEHVVTKARHWALTVDGELTECVECPAFRQAWAEWRHAHARRDVDQQHRISA